MNCFTAIFFVLQITFTFKDKVIKDPVIESFEQINDQIWYPFIPVSYTHLDVYKRQVLLSQNWMKI